MVAKTADLPNLRRLFVPDPDYIIIDVDLERADAQVVAWEADDEELKQMFREGVDIHEENSRTIGCSRQQAKVGVHACLSEDHEVLTPNGWKNITEKPPIIMSWFLDGSLEWTTTRNWYDKTVHTKMLEWSDRAFSQKVTWDHRMPYSTNKEKYSVTKAWTLPKSARLPKAGIFIGGDESISIDEARLFCAIQADGSKSKKRYRFHLKKKRKIQRLHSILKDLNIDYNFSEYKDGTTNTSFIFSNVPKRLGAYLLNCTQEALVAYVK